MKSAIRVRLAKMFLLSLVFGGMVAGIGWYIGWNTALQFSNAFFGVGSIFMVVGIFSIIGAISMRSDYKVLYSQSAGIMNLRERNQRWLADMTQSYNSFIYFFLVGGVQLLIALLVWKLF